MLKNSQRITLDSIPDETISIQDYKDIRERYAESKRENEKYGRIKSGLEIKMRFGLLTEGECELIGEVFRLHKESEENVFGFEKIMAASRYHLVN